MPLIVRLVKAGARWYDLVPVVPDKVGELGYYWTALTDKDSGSRSADYSCGQ